MNQELPTLQGHHPPLRLVHQLPPGQVTHRAPARPRPKAVQSLLARSRQPGLRPLPPSVHPLPQGICLLPGHPMPLLRVGQLQAGWVTQQGRVPLRQRAARVAGWCMPPGQDMQPGPVRRKQSAKTARIERSTAARCMTSGPSGTGRSKPSSRAWPPRSWTTSRGQHNGGTGLHQAASRHCRSAFVR